MTLAPPHHNHDQAAPSTEGRRPQLWALIAFIVVALGCGWVGVLLDRKAGIQPGQEGLGLALWIAVPMLFALVLRLITGGWNRGGFRPRFAASWRWYLLAIALPLAVCLLLVGVALALGVARFTASPASWLSFGASMIGANIIKNNFEEWAWRGYLTAELVAHRLPDWAIYLVVAVVWGAWHLPYYHAFLDPKLIASVLPINGIWFGLWGCLAIGAMGVTLVELFRLSGSVWPPVLFHAVFNSFNDTLQTRGFLIMDVTASWWLSPIVGVFSAVLYLGIGLSLRTLRLRRNRTNLMPEYEASASARP